MRVVRRGTAALLGVLLLACTAAFSLRWVDLATREVAAVQAVLPVTGTAVVLLTLVALVCRFRRLAVAGAVPSLVALVLAAASFGPLSGGRPAPATGVTVLSQNMEFGLADPADIVGAVKDRRADLVVLVEVTPQAVGRLTTAGLDAELPYAVSHAEAGTTGAVIRSRWPLTLVDEGKGTGGSLFWQPVVDVQRPEGAVRVKAIHTRQPIVSASGWHDDLGRIADWQRAQPTTEPVVLAGDFNASQAHPAYRSMLDGQLDGLVDAHRAAGAGWVRTWPQGRRTPPFVQLDHIVGRGITPVDAGVVPVRNTDHAAVWATMMF